MKKLDTRSCGTFKELPAKRIVQGALTKSLVWPVTATLRSMGLLMVDALLQKAPDSHERLNAAAQRLSAALHDEVAVAAAESRDIRWVPWMDSVNSTVDIILRRLLQGSSR